jgi:23S rRNA (adenine2503-C2)-methyltransferase
MPDALCDFDLPSLEAQLRVWGLPAAHGRPLLRWYYDRSGDVDFASLEIPKFGAKLRDLLMEHVPARKSAVRSSHASEDGAVKLLVEFARGGSAEAVLMPAYRADRAACCVSSQIGCAMGCDFCASALNGLQRNLDAGEIVEQFLHLRAVAARMNRRLTSLVFMGMGEPMQNLPAVLAAIGRIAHPLEGALGWRQITVSTVGIVPGIDALADADLNVHLALSLHAADDPTRSRIVPMNRRWNVAAIMSATRRFADRTGRIPTIEYCLLEGVNDSDEHAARLAALMAGFRAHVNLIPYNPIGLGLAGRAYTTPSANRVARFVEILRAARVITHIRRPRGDDVSAACGQLRSLEIASQNHK